MAGIDANNLRGPCESCGAPLATDQRYCVECGQRVGPPLAIPYLPGPPGTAVPGQARFVLPIPLQMASTFAAMALGFGVVVGTAISPEASNLIAAPTVVAQAPPTEPPASSPEPSTGGGVPSSSPVGPSSVVASTPTSSTTTGG